MDILTEYRNSLAIARDSLTGVLERADQSVIRAIELLYRCEGRVAVVGMGKCGYVGQKVAATMASTGTPAYYLHPAEALHGDLGFVSSKDAALVLSNSGETTEITDLLPHLRRLQVRLVAMTAGRQSTLAKWSDAVLDTSVPREADTLGLAPTASTTAMLAVGDALAAALMKLRGFTREAYAVFHPGGSLGQKLLCRVEELMHRGSEIPICGEHVSVREALFEITSKRLGATFVVDSRGALTGVFTDGDMRRAFQRESAPLELALIEVMTRAPRTVKRDELAVDALRKMEEAPKITLLAVMDETDRLVGALHIHDLVRAGIQ